MAENKKELTRFEKLCEKNVTKYTEKKNGLTYLSWTYAWQEFKKEYPNATYEIKHWDGKPYLFDENLGYMVETTVSTGDEIHSMWLPVMNSTNKAQKHIAYEIKTASGKIITVEPATMFDINTTIMRCLVKNLAMFGLGLYIYAGEDLPEDIREYTCAVCGAEVKTVKIKGEVRTPKEILDTCGGMCLKCYKEIYNKDIQIENTTEPLSTKNEYTLKECLKDNKVKLITSTLIKPAIDYVRNKYGRDFHKNFIITKQELKTRLIAGKPLIWSIKDNQQRSSEKRTFNDYRKYSSREKLE